MTHNDRDQRRGNTARGSARLVDSIPDKGRRSFLRGAMASGIAAPVALASFSSTQAAAQSAESTGATPNAAAAKRTGLIVRDFSDPYLELMRLLREGAEVEHAVMLEYLYCAFSIKDSYQGLIGFGAPMATNVLGVAVQEMQHMGAVNRFLVALGGSPHLARQDFPYEPDIYPFPFALEPLSRKSAAKYAYLEGPADIFRPDAQRSPEDAQFGNQVMADIGDLPRPNHVGSLYRNILELFDEAATRPGFPLTPAQVEEWKAGLIGIMEEGEEDHFNFFRDLHQGKHPAFANAGVDNVWDLPTDHEAYPSHQLSLNPTAFIGHPNQIEHEDAQAIAWLGNLHYWVSLCLLDYSYRYDSKDAWDLSVAQMMTGLWPLAAELPKYGMGMPFDPLSMGYSPGTGKEESRQFTLALARETQEFARTIEALLPARYQDNADGVFDLLGAA
jgi:hypothetical protein